MEIYDEMAKYNFSVRRRDTFEEELKIDIDGQPYDMSGKTAAAQIRPKAGSETLTAQMTCSVNASTSTITFGLTSAQTAELTAGKYAYDLCIIDTVNGEEWRKYLLGGDFYVIDSVTE